MKEKKKGGPQGKGEGGGKEDDIFHIHLTSHGLEREGEKSTDIENGGGGVLTANP